MRLKKILKTSLIGTSILLPITATTIAVASCGHKNTPPPTSKPTFDDFAKAANSESLNNIIKQTNPSGWNALPSNDLSKITNKNTQTTVVVTIKSKSKQETAEFTATYITDTAYALSDWECSSQPTPIITWPTFEKQVMAMKPSDIYAQLQTAKGSLPNVNIDFSKITSKDFTLEKSLLYPDETKQLIVFELNLTSAPEMPFQLRPVALSLEIKFNYIKYSVNSWSLNYTLADFLKTATTSVGTDEWKSYAATSLNPLWKAKDCTFGDLKNSDNDTFTMKISHGFDEGTATLKFVTDPTTKKVMIYGEQSNSKTTNPKETNPWAFKTNPKSNWGLFKTNVQKLIENNVKISTIIRGLSNSANYPTNWGKQSTSDDAWWKSHTFSSTQLKVPDDTKHIMFYTMSISPQDQMKQFTFNILVTEKDNSADVTAANFTDDPNQQPPHNYDDADWFNDMKPLIIATSSGTNNTLIISVCKGGYDATKWPNLAKWLNNQEFPDLALWIQISLMKGVTVNGVYQIEFGAKFILKTKPGDFLTGIVVFAITRSKTPQIASVDQIKTNGIIVKDMPPQF